MKITFLGTGTSQGVPFIGCDCAVCTSPDKRDNRLRTSVWVEVDGISIVIDSGPDFRYQMLRAGVRKLDAIIYTHGHKDHVAGLDDVRAFNFHTGSAVDIFANDHTQEILRREFKYVFESQGYPGVPQLNVHTITHEPFDVFGVKITPVRVLHYKLEVYGFRIGDFTYITDANYIAPEEMKKLKGSKALVLNALRHQEHISHYTLEQAIAVAGEVKAEHSYFTHISHQLGLHAEIDAHLPAGMHLAYDGLVLNL